MLNIFKERKILKEKVRMQMVEIDNLNEKVKEKENDIKTLTEKLYKAEGCIDNLKDVIEEQKKYINVLQSEKEKNKIKNIDSMKSWLNGFYGEKYKEGE